MITAEFKFNDNDFRFIADTWSQTFNREVGSLLKDRAGMLGRYIAESTQPSRPTGGLPSGGSLAEKHMGQNAIRGDIAKIIDGVSAKYEALPPNRGKRILKYGSKTPRSRSRKKVKTGQTYLVDEDLWMTNAAQLHRFHQSKRLSRGRVTSAGTYGQKVGRWKGRQRAVTTNALREDEIKKSEKRVGWAKSAWITAARSISSKGLAGVPVWVKQAAPGSATGRFTGDSPFIRLTSAVKYASDVLRDQYLARALVRFQESLAKDMLIQVQKALSTK